MFKRRPMIYYRELRLGQEVMVGWDRAYTHCKFVKVTPKGFNFLILATNRMYLYKHCYQRGMRGKEYPKKGNFKVKVTLPQRFVVSGEF